MQKFLVFLLVVSCGGGSAIPSQDAEFSVRRQPPIVALPDAGRDSGIAVDVQVVAVDSGLVTDLARGVDSVTVSLDSANVPDLQVRPIDSQVVLPVDSAIVLPPPIDTRPPVDALSIDVSTGGTRALGAACETADQCVSGVCFATGTIKRCCERDCGECGTCTTGYCEKRSGACGKILSSCSDSCNIVQYRCKDFVCEKRTENCCISQSVCNLSQFGCNGAGLSQVGRCVILSADSGAVCGSHNQGYCCPSKMCTADYKACL